MKTNQINSGVYTIKTKREKSDLPMCPTCKQCKDRSICKNRKDLKKCDRCKKCKDKENCDKYYINSQNRAFITVGKDLITGKPIIESFKGKTQEEAWDRAYQRQKQLRQSNKPIEYKIESKTIVIIAQEIEDSKYRVGKTRGNAYRANMATLNRIRQHKFANIPIEKVTREQIETFLESERKKSNSIIKKDYRMLKYVYDYASYNLNIMVNFFEGIKAIERPKSLKEDKDVQALTLAQQRQLEEYLSKHPSKKTNIILICLYTGIRIGENLAIDYKEDIDLQAKTLRISKTLTKDKNGKTIIGPTKTVNGKRTIAINELTESILQDSLNNVIVNKNDVLFCQDNKKLYEINTINSHFKRVCKNAGIKRAVNTHMLRHTFATRCIEAGVSAEVLQKLLGHANIETTINTYGDIFNYYKQKETQKYIDYLKNEEV